LRNKKWEMTYRKIRLVTSKYRRQHFSFISPKPSSVSERSSSTSSSCLPNQKARRMNRRRHHELRPTYCLSYWQQWVALIVLAIWDHPISSSVLHRRLRVSFRLIVSGYIPSGIRESRRYPSPSRLDICRRHSIYGFRCHLRKDRGVVLTSGDSYNIFITMASREAVLGPSKMGRMIDATIRIRSENWFLIHYLDSRKAFVIALASQ